MIAPGGVCAVLDYEIDQMTDYVSEMTLRLLPSAKTIMPSLRKFVSGLLSSTRLPSTTILLGMHYLAKRANMSNVAGKYNITEREVWRMLTVGLLLGSKFLDDNTFQNRSWSEVSGVPVMDLNKLETEWLLEMNYCIYVNLDSNSDFNAWMSNWEHWRKVKNDQRKATLDLLTPVTPLDNSAQRVNTSFSQPFNTSAAHSNAVLTSIEPPPGFKHGYNKNIWGQSYNSSPYLTPPSAPNSGLNTPVYMNMNTNVIGAPSRYTEWASLESFNNRSYNRMYPSQIPVTTYQHHPIQVAAYHTPIYHGPDFRYGQSVWNHSPNSDLFCCFSCNDPRNNINLKNPPFTTMILGNQILAG